MSRRVYIVKRHNSDWWTLLLAAFIVVYSKEFLILGLFLLAVWVLIQISTCRERSRNLQEVNEAAIGLEADHQNMLYLQGDPMGTYGRYDGYTMPLTVPQDATFPYRDFDDGMRNWK